MKIYWVYKNKITGKYFNREKHVEYGTKIWKNEYIISSNIGLELSKANVLNLKDADKFYKKPTYFEETLLKYYDRILYTEELKNVRKLKILKLDENMDI